MTFVHGLTFRGFVRKFSGCRCSSLATLTPWHFLFECPLYAEHRTAFLEGIDRARVERALVQRLYLIERLDDGEDKFRQNFAVGVSERPGPS